jgi:hypothetical protein
MKRVALLTLGILILSTGLVFAADEITVKPFAVIFAHYQYNMSGYKDYDARFLANDDNSFELTRSYLGLNVQLSKSWSANVTMDVARAEATKYESATIKVPTGVADDPATTDVDESLADQTVLTGTTSAKTGAYTPYVKYAFMNYQPYDIVGVSFGAIYTPYAWKQNTLWRHRYLMDAAFTQYGLIRSSTADLGVSVQGVHPDKYFAYNVAVLNGEGVKTAEINSGKALQASLFLSPFQSMDALKGLVLAGTYNYDKVQTDYPEMLYSSFAATLSYKYDFDKDSPMGFSVNGEFGQRTATTGSEINGPILAGLEDKSLTSQTISVWADFWFMTKYGIIARYDMVDPNTKNESKDPVTKDKWDAETHPLTYVTFNGLRTNISGYQDEFNFMLVGFWYQPLKPIRLCANYRMTSYTEEILDNVDASKGKAVTKAPDQYFFLNTELNFK